METTARPATVDDLAEISTLCQTGLEELRPNRGGSLWARREARRPPIDLSIRSTHDDPAGFLGVGTIDETIVGYVGVTVITLHDGTLVGDLTDIYVLPDARGVGVGEELMTLVIDWCTQHDCIGIDSIALPGDRATKNFFEGFGMVARAIRVHRSL